MRRHGVCWPGPMSLRPKVRTLLSVGGGMCAGCQRHMADNGLRVRMGIALSPVLSSTIDQGGTEARGSELRVEVSAMPDLDLYATN